MKAWLRSLAWALLLTGCSLGGGKTGGDLGADDQPEELEVILSHSYSNFHVQVVRLSVGCFAVVSSFEAVGITESACPGTPAEVEKKPSGDPCKGSKTPEDRRICASNPER